MSDIPQNTDKKLPSPELETDILGSFDIPESKTPLIKEVPKTNLLPWEEETPNTAEVQATTPAVVFDSTIIDINITSLEDIVLRITEKEYDFALIEPEDSQVKITFKQDNVDRNIVSIKFPIYSNILFKLKQTLGLVLENTSDTQEGKGSFSIDHILYKIHTKTAPGQNGERIWMSAKKELSENGTKKIQKTSPSVIFWFLAAILFVCLVLGGTFITFVVLNAKTIDDVKFFASLGISLNDINSFLSNIVTFIFSILLFLLTLVLSISLFKFFLTKKSLKRKKILYGLLSLILLLSTFGTGSAWMIIDQKIKQLPNWEEEAYGDLKIFDNDLLVSGVFEKSEALLSQTENLIWPVTLNFDLENFQNAQERKGFSIKKYTWTIGGETIDTFTPVLTKTFEEKGNYEISVTAIGSDTSGENIEQVLSNMPTVGINNIIKIKEDITSNGGKKLSFDARDLESLGKVSWYFKEPITAENPTPSYKEWTKIDEWYDFIPGKIFFSDIFIWISLNTGEVEAEESINKVIAIQNSSQSDISWEIGYTSSLEDELSLDFFIKNPKTSFWNGFIESYQWKIEDKIYTIQGDNTKTEVSPSVSHTFKNFGEQKIEVILTDSTGKTATITQSVSIEKNVELIDSLAIFDVNDQKFSDFRYEEKSHEYFIDALGIPATLKFDARYIRPSNLVYVLQDVTWDIKNDGNIDATGKSFTFEIPTEGNHIVVAQYTFVHRKNPDDTIILKEFLYIEGIKKEAILDLQIEKDSNYAPVSVRFDSSKSYIKNDNIIKFTYDYGDGISEERDAINPGHKYAVAGDYTVKLTVTGESGKTYSIEKKLILLPPPQDVKISTSLRKAPIGQGIDFSSSESSGQIIEYFWDFGDGEISTEANPTHSYKKAGDYTVKLRVEFINSNSISDEIEIQIN